MSLLEPSGTSSDVVGMDSFEVGVSDVADVVDFSVGSVGVVVSEVVVSGSVVFTVDWAALRTAGVSSSSEDA